MRASGRRFNVTFGILTVILAGLFLAGFGTSAVKADSPEFFQFTTDPGSHWAPRTDGKTVVWWASAYGDEAHSKIFGWRYSPPDQTTPPGKFQVADNAFEQKQPDVAGNWVVWQQGPSCSSAYYEPTSSCHRDIQGKNLLTGQQIVIAASNGKTDETDPAISGNWVVWLSRDAAGAFSLKGRDISTMAPAVTLTAIKAEPSGRPAIDGNRVIWGELTNRDNLAADWQLKSLQIGPNVVTTLDKGHGENFVLSFDIRGDLVVYASLSSEGWILKVLTLSTNNRQIIVGTKEVPGNPYFPTTDGRYVYYSDYVAQYPNYNIVNSLAYDTQTGSYFAIQKDKLNAGYINLYTGGGYLVGVNSYKASSQIFGDFPYNYLPSSRQYVDSSTPDHYYFPETGHKLANGFKSFWDKNGGLAVFGYSQTEEFSERNPDTGKIYTVQYFERQRYEYHPENAGTPYEVLLGRLGVADATRRNLLNTPAFQPFAEANLASCHYFVETRHSACDYFLHYWQTHGLDLGEPGFSYRESLALFGLPISEPYTDPQTGLVTQYFERARFEYHPENQDPNYQVLLGLLGDQALQNRGWVAGT